MTNTQALPTTFPRRVSTSVIKRQPLTGKYHARVLSGQAFYLHYWARERIASKRLA